MSQPLSNGRRYNGTWRLEVKNPPANAEDTRDAGSAPGLRRSPGEGNGYALQDSWKKEDKMKFSRTSLSTFFSLEYGQEP